MSEKNAVSAAHGGAVSRVVRALRDFARAIDTANAVMHSAPAAAIAPTRRPTPDDVVWIAYRGPEPGRPAEGDALPRGAACPEN